MFTFILVEWHYQESDDHFINGISPIFKPPQSTVPSKEAAEGRHFRQLWSSNIGYNDASGATSSSGFLQVKYFVYLVRLVNLLWRCRWVTPMEQ